jgi:hypothetical protein
MDVGNQPINRQGHLSPRQFDAYHLPFAVAKRFAGGAVAGASFFGHGFDLGLAVGGNIVPVFSQAGDDPAAAWFNVCAKPLNI